MFHFRPARAACLGLALCAGLGALPAFADQKVTVLLDWFLNPDHAAIIAAQQIGAFKKAGLDVELVQPTDASMPPRLVAAGKADIAVGYQSQLYSMGEEGVPVVRIATLIDQPLNTLMAVDDGKIKTLADLKGKTIGYSVSGIEQAIVGTMLKSAGVEPSQVKMVNVNFQLVPSLLTHKTDAVVGAYRTFEATEMEQEGAKPKIFKVEDYGIPAYDELILMARKDKADSPEMKAFIGALKEGVAYLKANPQKSWDQFAKDHPDLDNKLNKAVWFETVPMFPDDPGALDVARYKAYGDFLLKNGIIKKELPMDDYAVAIN